MKQEKKILIKSYSEIGTLGKCLRVTTGEKIYMEKFLDITPGSVSVLGLMNDTEHQVKLLIDEEVLDSEYFGCHPCINTSSLRMRTADLIEKVLPAMGHDFVKVKL